MDIPNAGSHISVTKKGHLQKLSSRSFPYIPHPWKRKFCVLVKGQLFYYEKEDSKGADKGCGVINLEYYDQVVEAPSKECKKATNVFVLTSHDRSFFDPGRHLFSAESPKELQEWMRHLKRAIEQIRNNNRTAGAGAGSFLKPSTPRQSGGAPKDETAKAEGGGALKAQGGGARKTEGWPGAGKDKTKRKDGVEEDGQGKRRNEEEVENKENLEDWTDSKGRKQKYSDTSLRRRKGNPSSRSMDESSLLGSLLAADNSSKGGGTNAVGSSLLAADNSSKGGGTNAVGSSLLAADNSSKGGGTNAVGRKKGAGGTSDPEPNSGPNSLGRQLKLGGKLGPDFSRIGSGGGQVDVEGMMFGSLSRQSKVEGSSAKGSASGVSGDSGCSGSGGSSNVERRKRKADDDGLVEEDDGASAMKTSESGPQLESVTKHRVKGPAGRRMPQNRRTQHQMMKQRASSLSALAHNADNIQSPDNPTARLATPRKREPSSCSAVPEETGPCREPLGTPDNRNGFEQNRNSCSNKKKEGGGGLLGDDLKESIGNRFRVSNLMEEVLGKLSNGVTTDTSDGKSGVIDSGEKEENGKSPTEDPSSNLKDMESSKVGDGDTAEPGDSTKVNVSFNNINNNRSACDNRELDVEHLSNGSAPHSLDCFACRCCSACRDPSGKCFCDSISDPVGETKLDSTDDAESQTKTNEVCELKGTVDEDKSETQIVVDELNVKSTGNGFCDTSEIKNELETPPETDSSQGEENDEVITKENDKNNAISSDSLLDKDNCFKCGIALKKYVIELNKYDGTEKSENTEESTPIVDSGKVQLRKASHSSDVVPGARIETLTIDTFDDIDDALFFKPSRVLFDDVQTSNSKDEDSDDKTSKSKKGRLKKRVTMDNNSINKPDRSDSDASKSRMSRFRKTLTSFRRIRQTADSNLSDDHPDEVTETPKSSFCVIL